jgi:hypothetical protein
VTKQFVLNRALVNRKDLSNSIKIAKDVYTNNLPKVMFQNDLAIPDRGMPDRFAHHFDTKIKSILEEITIDDQVCKWHFYG